MGRDVRKSEAKAKRAKRVRFHIRGTSERPRLTVFRSNKNIFAQLVDDTKGMTLVCASAREAIIQRPHDAGDIPRSITQATGSDRRSAVDDLTGDAR